VLPEIGSEGQEQLLNASTVVIGCGALGSVQAQLLARAGVGRIRIVDRDVLELNNLQRQVIFNEEDVAAGLPKAEAAARKLRKINSSIEIEGLVEDVTPRNIEELITDVDIVLDGTDNIETRYLINDACVKHKKPWIYGGVIGTTGMAMPVLPGEGPCIRCLFPETPPPGSLPTCDTVGVLNTAPATVASIQVTEAIKLLVGKGISKNRLLTLDLWTGSYRFVAVQKDTNCPCCGQGRFDFLEAKEVSWTTTLCGRNSVQISPSQATVLSLDDLSRRLAQAGKVSYNGLLLQFQIGDHELIIFPNGRTIVKGTTDEAVAKSLYSKYLGN
jgi:adenylyltransferase/sulfurtransferase